MDISVEEIVKLAVAAGRMASEQTQTDAYKATERRLYALPILREKLERDRARVVKLTATARTDLEAAITADAAEVETLDQALAACAGDPYYQTVTGRYFEGLDDKQMGELLRCDATTVWRNRKRLVQRISVYLYGSFASR